MQCDDDFYCIFYSCMQKEYQILHYEPNTTLLNISSQAQSYSIVHPDFSIIVCVESVEMYRRLQTLTVLLLLNVIFETPRKSVIAAPWYIHLWIISIRIHTVT